MWSYTRTNSHGKRYTQAYVAEHPNANKRGFVLEHRVVMENILGRLLEPGEVVHHKDENGKNNSPDNLALLTPSAHTSLHLHKAGPTYHVCPVCDETFTGRARQLYCSKKCARRDSPPPVQVKKHVVPHGTTVGYGYHKCRCSLCREAKRVEVQKYRSKNINLGVAQSVQSTRFGTEES